MTVYTGQSGNTYMTATSFMGKGKTSKVFELQNHYDKVVKVYKPADRTTGRELKLKHMVTLRPLPKRAAWPDEIINETGEFSGYVMKKISDSKTINEVYASNDQIGNLEFRLAVAHYLCDAVHEVHELGQVVGDFNPSNIMVNRNGYVTLVDTDSFHIQNPNNAVRPFRCIEAHSEFVAPELIEKAENGMTYANMPLETFTKETDRFAVAIHIFALLMNGYNPYIAGAKIIPGESIPAPPTKEGGIKLGFTPYFMTDPKFKIPDDAPAISTLPLNIQQMFRLAFVEGHKDPSKRPTCSQMAVAIKKWFSDVQTERLTKAAASTTSTLRLPARKTTQAARPVWQTAAGQSKNNQPASQKDGRLKVYGIVAAIILLLAVILMAISVYSYPYEQESDLGIMSLGFRMFLLMTNI